ncbi:hypothetical protein [Vibrio phage RYC]|nr:hypothetical protein [Vibrio phage RYC]
MNKVYLKELFEKCTDGVPESMEDLLEKDLYKEVSHEMLVNICKDSKFFKEEVEEVELDLTGYARNIVETVDYDIAKEDFIDGGDITNEVESILEDIVEEALQNG